MAYEIVKTLKCVTNEMINDKGFVDLTVGEIYDSAYCNSTPNAEHFGVYDDNGGLCNFNKRYFEVYETYVRENTGWEIKCKDCYNEISINELIKNNYMCPKCGQKFEFK